MNCLAFSRYLLWSFGNNQSAATRYIPLINPPNPRISLDKVEDQIFVSNLCTDFT